MAITVWVLVEVLRALSWGNHTAAGEYVFKSKVEMLNVWQQDGGKEDRMPAVDFDKEMVIAVFAGEKPGTGHRIKIDTIVHDKEDTTGIVIYTSVSPDKESHTTQKTYPCHLVVVKKSEAKYKFVDGDTAEGKAVAAELKKSMNAGGNR